MLRRWGVLQDNLVLSTHLIMSIDHRKEIRKLTFRALAFRRSEYVGRKTLVGAGHVTTQNLGGEKICWAGWVAECFDCSCDKLFGFQNLKQSLKTTRSIGVRSRILPMKNATLFLPSPKCRILLFTEKFDSPMEQVVFDG